MASSTYVIQAGLSKPKAPSFWDPYGLAPDAPELSPLTVRRVLAALLAEGAEKYQDNLFHGLASPWSLYSLISGLSVHEAEEQGFQSFTTGNHKYIVIFGVRWEVLASAKEVTVFGPRSDPSKRILIDLLQEQSSNPKES